MNNTIPTEADARAACLIESGRIAKAERPARKSHGKPCTEVAEGTFGWVGGADRAREDMCDGRPGLLRITVKRKAGPHNEFYAVTCTQGGWLFTRDPIGTETKVAHYHIGEDFKSCSCDDIRKPGNCKHARAGKAALVYIGLVSE